MHSHRVPKKSGLSVSPRLNDRNIIGKSIYITGLLGREDHAPIQSNSVIPLATLANKFGLSLPPQTQDDAFVFPDLPCNGDACRGFFISFANDTPFVVAISYYKFLLYFPLQEHQNAVQGPSLAFPDKNFRRFSILYSRGTLRESKQSNPMPGAYAVFSDVGIGEATNTFKYIEIMPDVCRAG